MASIRNIVLTTAAFAVIALIAEASVKVATIGVQINGRCSQSSRCPPLTPLSIGQADSLTFAEIEQLPNGDVFRIFGTIGTKNPDGKNVSGAEPFSVVYQGHLSGADLLCQPTD